MITRCGWTAWRRAGRATPGQVKEHAGRNVFCPSLAMSSDRNLLIGSDMDVLEQLDAKWALEDAKL